jgi:hypothetical protein
MIKFEHNMLVLNNAFSKEDVEQIDDFAEYIRNEERERIIALIEFHRQYMIDSRKAGQVDVLLAEERYARLIALIKGESK